MLDRKFLRENRELVENSVRAKRESVDIEAYYAQDERRRAALQETETLQAEANRANKAIAEARKAGEDTSDAIARMKEVSARIKDLKADADACEQAEQAESRMARRRMLDARRIAHGGQQRGVFPPRAGDLDWPAALLRRCRQPLDQPGAGRVEMADTGKIDHQRIALLALQPAHGPVGRADAARHPVAAQAHEHRTALPHGLHDRSRRMARIRILHFLPGRLVQHRSVVGPVSGLVTWHERRLGSAKKENHDA